MDKLHQAIERLKMASDMSLTFYEKPLIITTSGGKDSDVCLALARISGIPYEVVHNHTTADAPQTVRYVRSQFKDLELSGVKCTVSLPMYKGRRTSLWELMPLKLMPPTRLARYCCAVLKESHCGDRMITTGVRWDESVSRKKNRGIYEAINSKKENSIILANDNDDTRRIFENCKLKAKRVCNPIVDWTHRDVWDFIKSESLSVNLLYDMGFERVGCIGCPMAGDKRYTEFRLFPAYEQMYKKSFARVIAVRKAAGKTNEGLWNTPEGLWAWWMEEDFNQITMDQWAEICAEMDGVA